MTYFEFEFNDKRPSDFGQYVKVKSHDIGFPAKTKVTASIPFSSHIFDFSTLYGSQVYAARKVTYVINVVDAQNYTVETMHQLTTQLVNWLMAPYDQQPLYDDKLPGYHFMAEVQDAPALADSVRNGELTVEFDCYPFMIADRAEGDDDWDTFDFEDGVAQDVGFDVSGTKTVILSNPGVNPVDAQVDVSGGDIIVAVGGTSYTLSEGGNSGVSIPAGDSYVTLTGTGTISFEFYREVL